MQPRCDEYAGRAGVPQRFEIGGIADPASGIQAARSGALLYRCEPVEIGTGAAANPRESHDDDAVGPEPGRIEKIGRAEEIFAAEIEGENGGRVARSKSSDIPQALAADNAANIVGRRHSGARGAAGIEPKFDVGVLTRQVGYNLRVLARFLDRIEIGDVHAGKCMQLKQSREHIARHAGWRQTRDDRLIGIAVSSPRMNNMPGFEIEDGYDLHALAIALTSQHINKSTRCAASSVGISAARI